MHFVKKFADAFYYFFSDDLKIEALKPSQIKSKPAVEDLGFGKLFTDHMLRIKWSESKGWETPLICQLQNFEMHPAAKVSTLDHVTSSKKPPFRLNCCRLSYQLSFALIFIHFDADLRNCGNFQNRG